MASLKSQKQQFVSDLVGGPVEEIYSVLSIAATAYIFYRLLAPEADNSLLLDLMLNAAVPLLSITLYANDINTLHYGILIPIVIVGIIKFTLKLSSKNTTKRTPQSVELLAPKAFITVYRSQMLILTNLAILAVDFHVFPRRFAKVETWGTSIMDLGVGSFVFSMGLANSRSIMRKNMTHTTQSFSVSKYVQLIFSNTRKALPMLILGLIRLVSVKKLDYQEHMTEYGVHWNFFFTLGLLPVFLAVLDPVMNRLPRFFVAWGISVLYEVALSNTDLLKFILTDTNRFESWLTMNKEGIFSFLGYLSIFIFGQAFGSFVLTNEKTANNLLSYPSPDFKTRRGSRWLTVTPATGLLIMTILFQGAFFFVNRSPLFYNVSRRLANLPYVLLTVSWNSLFLFIYCIVGECFGNHSTQSTVLDAVNRNGLLSFLLGNLGTGMINMTINTLEYSDKAAFGILMVYISVLVFIAIVLDRMKIYIKI